jgi:hypothetical protein
MLSSLVRKAIPVSFAALALAGASPVHAAGEPCLVGDGTTVLSADFGPLAGDAVRFTFQARGVAYQATGRFHVTHTLHTDGSVLADFDAQVDCLAVGRDVAVVSGVITQASGPAMTGTVGRRVGVTVEDDPRFDAVGWSWMTASFVDGLPKCLSSAPISTIGRGGFRVQS